MEAPDTYNLTRVSKILKALLVIAVLGFALWKVVPVLNSDILRDFVSSAGVWAPLVLIGYVVLSHVVAPLGGIPALIVGAAVFGVPQTMLYIYLAGLVSAPINFAISKTLGRKWVQKLTGEKTLTKIDDLVSVSGNTLLIIGRIFGSAIYEEISYAFGLTAMTFKRFFVITALASIIPHGAYGYFFRNTDFSAAGNIFFFLGVVLAVGFGFSVVFVYHARGQKMKGVSEKSQETKSI